MWESEREGGQNFGGEGDGAIVKRDRGTDTHKTKVRVRSKGCQTWRGSGFGCDVDDQESFLDVNGLEGFNQFDALKLQNK